MNVNRDKSPWESHDWKVKTLESLSAGGGSRLAYTCRSCERRFSFMTASSRAWAVAHDGQALSDEVSSRWLGQHCPGHLEAGDAHDREQLKHAQ